MPSSVRVNVAVLSVAAPSAGGNVAMENIVADRLTEAGHNIAAFEAVRDSETAIRSQLTGWLADPDVDVVVVVGDGEGINPALKPLVDQTLPGFADLLRMLAYQEVGASAMLSAAEAARCGTTFVFVLPANENAVKAAMEKLILPQLDPKTKPRNLIGSMPRLRDAVEHDVTKVDVTKISHRDPDITRTDNAKIESARIESARRDSVPTMVAAEKTANGAGVAAKLPAAASAPVAKPETATQRPRSRTGANVIVRKVEDHTKPIELEKLEQQLALSAEGPPPADVTKTAVKPAIEPAPRPNLATKPLDIGNLRQPAPPSATATVAKPLPSITGKPPTQPPPVDHGTGDATKPLDLTKPTARTSRPRLGNKPEDATKPMDLGRLPKLPPGANDGEDFEQLLTPPPKPSPSIAAEPAPQAAEPATTPVGPAGIARIQLKQAPVSVAKPARTTPVPLATTTPPPSAMATPALARGRESTTPPASVTAHGRESTTAPSTSPSAPAGGRAWPPPASTSTPARGRESSTPPPSAMTPASARGRESSTPPPSAASMAAPAHGRDSTTARAASTPARDREWPSSTSTAATVHGRESSTSTSTSTAATVRGREPSTPPPSAMSASAPARVRQPTPPPPSVVRAQAPEPEPELETLDPDALELVSEEPVVPAASLFEAAPPPRRKPTEPPPNLSELIGAVPSSISELPRGEFVYPELRSRSKLPLVALLLLVSAAIGGGAMLLLKRDDDAKPVAQPTVAIDAAIDAAEVVAKVEIDAAPAPEPEPEPEPVVEPPPPDAAVVEKAVAPPRETPPSRPTARPTPRPAPAVKPVVAAKPETPTEKPEKAEKPEAPAGPVAVPGCEEVACVLEKYARPCCARFKPSNDAFQPSSAEDLSKPQIKAGVDKMKPRVIACGEQHPAKGTVKLSISVDSEGNVKDLSVQTAPDDALGECVAGVMRKAKFAKTANGGSFTYPFVF